MKLTTYFPPHLKHFPKVSGEVKHSNLLQSATDSKH